MQFRIRQQGSLAGIAFGIVALVLVLFGYVRGHATEDWQRAPGEIISCTLETALKIPFLSSHGQHGGGRGLYERRGRIQYRYTAQGGEHVSDTHEIGVLGFQSSIRGSETYLREVLKLCQKYRPGAAVVVWYDPADPSSAVIEKGYRGYLPTYLVFIAVVLGACLYGFLKDRA